MSRPVAGQVEKPSEDKVVFESNGTWFALKLSDVTAVVDVERICFIPGEEKTAVLGIISYRNEPVVVVDPKAALGITRPDASLYGKVIVVSDKSKRLGVYVGESETSFLREAELDDASIEQGDAESFIERIIAIGDKNIRIIDWSALYEYAAKILSKNTA